MEGRYDCKHTNALFTELKGKTLSSITGAELQSEQITFITNDNEKYTLTYYDDCCASCSIEDVIGDVQDLIGSPILLAEDVSSHEPEGEQKIKRDKERAEHKAKDLYYYEDSETWTFYKLSTIKGSVTLRWYGSSNGYYSESATFEKWKDLV